MPIAYRRRGAWGGGAPEPQWATAAAGPGGAPPEPPWATAALGPGVGHLVISLWSCPLLQINDYSAPCILFPRILCSLYPLPSSFPLHPRLFSSSEIVRPRNSASSDQFTLRLLPSQGSRFGAVPMPSIKNLSVVIVNLIRSGYTPITSRSISLVPEDAGIIYIYKYIYIYTSLA